MERTKKIRFLLLMVLIITTLFVGSGCEAEQNARMSQKTLCLTDLQKYQEGYIQGTLLQGFEIMIMYYAISGDEGITYDDYQSLTKVSMKLITNFTEENFIEFSEMLESLIGELPMTMSFEDITDITGFKDGFVIASSLVTVDLLVYNGVVSEEELKEYENMVHSNAEYPTPENSSKCYEVMRKLYNRGGQALLNR